MMLVSQIMAHAVDDVEHLWQASSALGIAYGATFGLFPTLVIEWFGIRQSFCLFGMLPKLTLRFKPISLRTGVTCHSLVSPLFILDCRVP